MATREDVLIRFGGDAKGVNSTLAGIRSSVSGLGSMLAGLGVGIGVGALASALKDTLSWADDLAETADRVGLTTDAIQSLRAEAELFGVTAEEVDGALTKFSINLGKAREGTGDLAAVFKQYNQSLAGTATEILGRYITLLQQARSEAEQNRIAVAGFGKAGAKMAQSIAESNMPLDQMVAKFKSLGLVVDEEGIRKLGELNDQFDRLAQQGITKFKQAIVGAKNLWDELAAKLSGPNSPLLMFLSEEEKALWKVQAAAAAADAATKAATGVNKPTSKVLTPDPSGVGNASEDFQKYLANLNKVAMTETQLRVNIWKKYGEEANAVRKGDEDAAIAAQTQQEELFKQLAQSGASKEVLASYAKIVGEIEAKPITVTGQIKMDPESYRALSLGLKEALTAGGAEIVTVPIKPYIVWGDTVPGEIPTTTVPAGQGITKEVDQTGANP